MKRADEEPSGMRNKPLVTLKEAIELVGIEDWDLTPEQQRFFLGLTRDLLKRHTRQWVIESRGLLQAQLDFILHF